MPLGLHLRHMEVLRLGGLNQSSSCLPMYTTATRDPSSVCDLCYSLPQHQIFNIVKEARDRTHILMVTSGVLNPLSHNRNSASFSFIIFVLYFIYLFCFLGPNPRHVEVPRLGVESELQGLAYTAATQDPSHVCDLYHISWQCQILNPLSKGRDQTRILMDTSRVRFRWPQWELPDLQYYISFRCTT